MKREIVINANPRETRVAIIEDDQLVELLVDRPEARRMVGDIYIGKVEAVLPGIQAAFVDIGTEKSAFLHASDLVQDVEDEEDDEDGDDDTDTDGEGQGVEAAEPEAGDSPYADATEAPEAAPSRRGRGNGGPRRTASRRARRQRRRRTFQGAADSGPGHPGSGHPGADLQGADLDQGSACHRADLTGRPIPRLHARRDAGRRQPEDRRPRRAPAPARNGAGGPAREERRCHRPHRGRGRDPGDVQARAPGPHCHLEEASSGRRTSSDAPSLVHRETSLTRGIIRDLFSDKVDALTVDSKQVYNEIVEYLKGIAPDLIDRVKLYEEPVPLFDKANIETEIRDLFKRRCDLPSGGYLIIEPTEALVSIDVNSGRYTGKKDPEKTILKTNLEAAREVARQLRLRDVGGIIVCDFIDMETKANRERVIQELRTHLAHDRARTKAFAVSDLGLIEMTRQRVRQSHLQSMTEPCPHVSRDRPGLHARGHRATSRAIVATDHRGREARQSDYQAAPGRGPVRARAGAGPRPQAGEGRRVRLELRDDPLLRPDEFKIVVKGAGRDVTQQYAVA